MKEEIKIPSLGESVSEAIISVIMKPSGSYVKRDEEILEIETDKVNQVLYAPADGVITLTVSVDDKVAVGQAIGFVDTDAKAPAARAKEVKEDKPVAEKKEISVSRDIPSTSGSGRKKIESFAHDVQQGEKPAVKEEKKSVSLPKAKKEDDGRFTRKKMSNLRKVIATKLVEAKNTTAMLTTFNEVDMSAVIELRTREKEAFEKKYGVKLGFMGLFVKAVVSALKAFPEVNAMIDAEEILQYHTYDIGMAVSTDKGLMVPVVKDCDLLTIADIEKALGEYATKARSGKISVEDLKGGSFTITNGGVFGSLLSTPILNTPQSAILGMHAIVKRPVAIDDKVEIRPMMYIALSYDHRIIDGKEAVQFLVHVKKMLEDPAKIFLDI